MPEIRFGITKKLNDILVKLSDDLGVDKSEYIKSLIINDLRERSVIKKETKDEDKQD